VSYIDGRKYHSGNGYFKELIDTFGTYYQLACDIGAKQYSEKQNLYSQQAM